MISPKASVTINTTPICTELMPPVSVNDATIGMKITMHGTGSIKSPTITNSATNANMIL